MEETFTIKEFAAKTGRNETYIRHCCAGYINPETGHRYRLPDGWLARKIGPRNRQSWEIFKAYSVEDSAEDDSTFDAYRTNAIKTFLVDVFENKSIRLDELARELPILIPKLLRNSELASLMAERWRYPRTLETVEDLRVWGIGTSPGLIGVSERANRRSIISDTSAPEILFERLGASFRAAVTSGQKVSINLEFFEDGTVRLNARDLKHDAELKEFVENRDIKKAPNTKSLAFLFEFLWFSQLSEQRRSKRKGLPIDQRYVDRLLEHPWMRENPHYQDFLKRCFHCGKWHGRRRRDAHFCDNTHKDAHGDWIRDHISSNETERRTAINMKLTKVFARISGTNRDVSF